MIEGTFDWGSIEWQKKCEEVTKNKFEDLP